MATTTRKPFAAHYRITVQKEADCLADTGIADIQIDGERSPDGDVAAVKRAIEIANGLVVGAEGRVEFKEYCVYVNYVPRACEPDLLATVVRAFAWDTDADYTYAKSHCGRIPYDVIDALNPADATTADE